VDLRFNEAELAFRERLRGWLASTLPTLPAPPGRDDWKGRRRFDLSWQRMLFEAGYAGVDWPLEYGGLGVTPTEQLIFLEETAAARAPYVGANFVGLLHAGPTLIVEGSPDQRAAHLPRILRGEEVWCQGFSEPDAGSDLASLRTRAVRDGDSYVVTGRKIWTSMAHIADYCELLVRTDPSASAPHRGITWLIMPMDAPGIEVRPLRTAGGSTEFSELILDSVRVPVANRVGAENDGWRVAMVTFSFERGTAFIGEVVESRNMLASIASLARAGGRGVPGVSPGETLWDASVRRDLGRLSAEVNGLWALILKNVSEAGAGRVPERGASVFKLRFTENRQKIADLASHVLGRAALSLSPVPGAPAAVGGQGGNLVEDRLTTLAYTIAAGTSQIQKNILAERALGLPKEPRWTSR
jgi:alkylation response protein AidB-like acyl-CoA dehydrogenase